ncbi:MAG: DUF2892 domain-containing protein [Leptospirillia bacterium]
MTVDEGLRLVAGAFLLISLLLAVYVNQNWLWFSAFIGVNLVQSAFTRWCPMMAILRKAGMPDTRKSDPGCC